MRRINLGLIVLGLALLSLTPAAPAFLRRPELLAVHAFRPLDALRERLERSDDDADAAPLPPEVVARIDAGIAEWDGRLVGGAAEGGVVARIVRINRVRRRLLIDAGEGVELRPGDPVTAGRYALGVVQRSFGGVAVVQTPWGVDARFAGASEDAAGAMVRLILAGLDRDEWTASVSHPEALSALLVDRDVVVPEVDDLLPPSVPRLRPGLILGRLRTDELLRRTGTEAFRVVPALDVRGLDAVCVWPSGASGVRSVGFERRSVEALSCGLASPGRDGLLLTGIGLPDGASVCMNGMFVGTIEAAMLGAARVRGVFDPGQDLCVLVLSARRPGPLVVRTERAWRGGGRFVVGRQQSVPEVGDLIVTAGRGDHVPRGMLIGAVVRVEGEEVDVLRGGLPAGARVEVLRRRELPADPWSDG